MKGARTSTGGDVVSSEKVTTEMASSAVACSTVAKESLVDTVEQLRAALRRKDEKLLHKDEELRVALANFAELDVSSREVEQELESEISRLSRLNIELENTNRNLERCLQNDLRRIDPAQLQCNDEVAQLRQKLQRLEQENDDLQTCVRRLEATEEALSHKLERTEEEVVYVQQELDNIKEEIEVVTNKHICSLTMKAYTAMVNAALLITPPSSAKEHTSWIRWAASQMTLKAKTMKAARSIV